MKLVMYFVSSTKHFETYEASSSEANFLALDQQSPAMNASIASFIMSAHTNTLAANEYSSYSIKRGPKVKHKC